MKSSWYNNERWHLRSHATGISIGYNSGWFKLFFSFSRPKTTGKRHQRIHSAQPVPRSRHVNRHTHPTDTIQSRTFDRAPNDTHCPDSTVVPLHIKPPRTCRDWGAAQVRIPTSVCQGIKTRPKHDTKPSLETQFGHTCIAQWMFGNVEFHNQYLPLVKYQMPLPSSFGSLHNRVRVATSSQRRRTHTCWVLVGVHCIQWPSSCGLGSTRWCIGNINYFVGYWRHFIFQSNDGTPSSTWCMWHGLFCHPRARSFSVDTIAFGGCGDSSLFNGKKKSKCVYYKCDRAW